MRGTRVPFFEARRCAVRLRRALGIAVALTFIACFDWLPWVVDSLKPVLTDSDAVEVPGLVGVWGEGDSPRMEIRQVGHDDTGPQRSPSAVARRPPTYLFRSIEGGQNAEGDTVPIIWDARVGHLSGRLVADLEASDSATKLRRMVAGYPIRLTHFATALELRGDTLRLVSFRPDSVREALARNQCVSPFIAMHPTDIVFTGTTEEVRRTYECLLRQPGVASDSAAPWHRMRPH